MARRAWFPIMVLIIGLASSAAASYLISRAVFARDQERFENIAARTGDAILDRMDTYTGVLSSAAGLFAANETVTREQFHAFVERLELQRRYPGIQGIGFTKRLLPHEVGPFVESVRRDPGGVGPGFHIWPDTPRDEYHTIVYLEPLDARNLAAIGYDMFTDPVRREAMERARDTGLPAASGRVTLVQEIDRDVQTGFLIYVPVYRTPQVPETVEQRREGLVGFVYSPFRTADLLEGIFGAEPRPRIHFRLYDGEQPVPEALMYDSAAPRMVGGGVPEQEGRFSTTLPLHIGGRRFSVVVRSRQAFELASARSLVPPIFAAGAVVTLVLAGLAWSQARARAAAERSAAETRLERERIEALNQRLAAANAELARQRENLETMVAQRTRELETSHERLRTTERLAALGTLSAGLGHDMGNLLLPARMRLDSLAAMDLPPDAAEEIAAIRKVLEYLGRMTNGLRMLSVDPETSGDTGDVVELGDWWREVGPLCRDVLPSHVALECSFPEEPLYVAASRPGLTQAVFNLIQNAADVMQGRESGRVEVRVEADRKERLVRLSVSDDGPGMPPEIQRHVFEPFFTTKTRRLSTGLGLPLVRGLVQRAGGRVDVDSAPGKGTTFTLVLHAARDAAPRDTDDRPVAVVAITDPRLGAFASTVLESLGFEVSRNGQTPPRGAALWFTEPSDGLASAAAAFLSAGKRRQLVLLGEPEDGLRFGEGVTVLPRRPGAAAMREALAAAARRIHGLDNGSGNGGSAGNGKGAGRGVSQRA